VIAAKRSAVKGLFSGTFTLLMIGSSYTRRESIIIPGVWQMRAIGTEMITFGAGLPVLYLAAADVFLGGLTPAAVMAH